MANLSSVKYRYGLSQNHPGSPHLAVDPPKLLHFPCEYPIKVLVRGSAAVRSEIDPLMVRHAGPSALSRVTERPSAQASFLSITYLIEAQSEQQIATLFAELKTHSSVVMVL
jgi:putative lipoic acid-binding regulatory protein